MQKLRSILKVGSSGALITDRYGSEKGVSLELMFGTAVTLEFDMRSGNTGGSDEVLPVIPLSELAAQSYYFAIDRTNSNAAEPALLRYSGIDCCSDSEGRSIFTVPLSFTATEKLKELMADAAAVECKAEIGGLDAEGRTIFAWQFALTLHSRVYIGSADENVPSDPAYYTAVQVEALIAREIIYEYSIDGESSWHPQLQDGDRFFRMRHGTTGGASAAQLIPYGPPGSSGVDAYPGQIIACAGNETPAGFLPCNGALVSRTTYAELFAAIGTLYGEGDGTDTFALPDLRNRFMQGAGDDSAGTVKVPGLPDINGSFHGIYGLAPSGGETFYSGAFNSSDSGNVYWNGDGSALLDCKVDFKASKANNIYGDSTTVQPPAVVINYAIKY